MFIWVDYFCGIDLLFDDIFGIGEEFLYLFVYGEFLLNGLLKCGVFVE